MRFQCRGQELGIDLMSAMAVEGGNVKSRHGELFTNGRAPVAPKLWHRIDFAPIYEIYQSEIDEGARVEPTACSKLKKVCPRICKCYAGATFSPRHCCKHLLGTFSSQYTLIEFAIDCFAISRL